MKKVEKIEEIGESKKIIISGFVAGAIMLLGSYAYNKLADNYEKNKDYEIFSKLTNDLFYVEASVNREIEGGEVIYPGQIYIDLYDDIAIVSFTPLTVTYDDGYSCVDYIPYDTGYVEGSHFLEGSKIVDSNVIKELISDGYKFNGSTISGKYYDCIDSAMVMEEAMSKTLK